MPTRWPYPVNAVMNAGATLVDGDTVLLCRVEDRRGFSHLSVARSADGVTGWAIGDAPALTPSPEHPEEEWGLEDPRISRVDELAAGSSPTPRSGPAARRSRWPPRPTSCRSTASAW